MSQKRPRIAKFSSEFFMFVLHLRRTEELGNPATLREAARSALQRLEQNAKKAQVDYENFQHAKFALVAFLDETCGVVRWSQAEAWKRNPMQFELYQRYDAGEQFFERLSFLRKDVGKYLEAIEVYYLCIVLGFKGKYQFVGREQLVGLQEQLHREIKSVVRHHTGKLAPEGYPREQIMEVVKKEIPMWVIFAVAASVGLLFYIVMSFLMSSTASTVIQAAS
jgi:type VI secretion system protein ImpK